MNDVKIVVAGIEMTPEQARKVHAELSRLFAPPAFFVKPVPVNVQPGQRGPEWGRYPDSTYMATFGLQKLKGGC